MTIDSPRLDESSTSKAPPRPATPTETQPLLDNESLDSKTETSPWLTEAGVLVRSSASLVVANLLQFSLNMSSMIIISPRGKIELGAVSVATTTANITGFIVFQGLATSLDTLCAQAWGSGQKQLYRLHVQRMMVLLSVASLPIAALWVFSGTLFSYILPDARTSALAGLYLKIIIFALPGFLVFESGKRILTARGIFLPVTGILCVGACTNVFCGWLLVWVLDLGYIGAPIAVAITWTLIPLYYRLCLAHMGLGGFWNYSTTKAVTGWGPMLRLALPSLLMVEAEYFAFEVLVIAAAQLSTASLAAQTILATLNGAFWQIPFSISIAGTTIIAQHIGAKSSQLAKVSAAVVFGFTFLCSTTSAIMFFTFRRFCPIIFTRESDVTRLVEQTLPYVAAMHLFDGLAACCNGILRGIGQQVVGGWVNLTLYYVVALPFSFWATFVQHRGLAGLWSGVTIGLILVVAFELIFVIKLDWQKSIQDADKRNRETKSVSRAPWRSWKGNQLTGLVRRLYSAVDGHDQPQKPSATEVCIR